MKKFNKVLMFSAILCCSVSSRGLLAMDGVGGSDPSRPTVDNKGKKRMRSRSPHRLGCGASECQDQQDASEPQNVVLLLQQAYVSGCMTGDQINQFAILQSIDAGLDAYRALLAEVNGVGQPHREQASAPMPQENRTLVGFIQNLINFVQLPKIIESIDDDKKRLAIGLVWEFVQFLDHCILSHLNRRPYDDSTALAIYWQLREYLGIDENALDPNADFQWVMSFLTDEQVFCAMMQGFRGCFPLLQSEQDFSIPESQFGPPVDDSANGVASLADLARWYAPGQQGSDQGGGDGGGGGYCSDPELDQGGGENQSPRCGMQVSPLGSPVADSTNDAATMDTGGGVSIADLVRMYQGGGQGDDQVDKENQDPNH